MDILKYLNEHYPELSFHISSFQRESILINLKTIHKPIKEERLFEETIIEYIECPVQFEFSHVQNKTMPYDMWEYYIEEMNRIYHYKIIPRLRKIKIKKLYEA
jgi:hypothetical protein